MNSKIVFFLMMTFTLASCGVKGPPVKYPETIVDSYVKSYTGAELSPEELERTQNKQAIPSTIDTQKINQPTTTTKP